MGPRLSGCSLARELFLAGGPSEEEAPDSLAGLLEAIFNQLAIKLVCTDYVYILFLLKNTGNQPINQYISNLETNA